MPSTIMQVTAAPAVPIGPGPSPFLVLVARAAVASVESRWRAKPGERRFREMADAIGRFVELEED